MDSKINPDSDSFQFENSAFTPSPLKKKSSFAPEMPFIIIGLVLLLVFLFFILFFFKADKKTSSFEKKYNDSDISEVLKRLDKLSVRLELLAEESSQDKTKELLELLYALAVDFNSRLEVLVDRVDAAYMSSSKDSKKEEKSDQGSALPLNQIISVSEEKKDKVIKAVPAEADQKVKKVLSSAPKKSQSKDTVKNHIVRQGETLFFIAKKYNISVKELCDKNKINEAYTIYPGQNLLLP